MLKSIMAAGVSGLPHGMDVSDALVWTHCMTGAVLAVRQRHVMRPEPKVGALKRGAYGTFVPCGNPTQVNNRTKLAVANLHLQPN
jgi:hypothetical protein